MGRLLPPVDVRSENQLNELNKRITAGPVTLVLVYADWCGHCTRFKPMMSQLENMPGRSVQTARIRDDMLPKSALAGTEIEGYPSVLLVKNDGSVAKFQNNSGEITNTVPEHNDMLKMATLVRNAGTPEGQNILNSSAVANSVINVKPNNVAVSVNKRNNSSFTPSPKQLTTQNLAIANQAEMQLANQAANASANLATLTNQNVSANRLTAMNAVNAAAVKPSGIPKSIVADRLSTDNIARLNATLVQSNNALLKNAAKPVGKQAQAGGSLYGTLLAATQEVLPIALLFGAAEALHGRKKTRKTRKARGSRKN